MSGVNNPAVMDEPIEVLTRSSGELLQSPHVVDGGDPPTGWSKINSAVLRSDDGYRSSRSLRLNPTAATGEWWSDRVRVKPNAILLLSARVKGTGSVNVELRVRYWDSMSAFISEDGIAAGGACAEWTEIRRFTEAPAAAFEADARWVVVAADTADIGGDAFSLRQVGG